MMKNFLMSSVLASVLCLSAALTVFAQTSANFTENASKTASRVENASLSPAKKAAIFPLEDLKPGMKGVARTVFSGTKPEEFGVEILGVMPGFVGPRQSGIVIRLSGTNAERTFVFAGMSGSPVYIDGKLVGAIAYSFPFAKEPMGAVTPIQDMIRIFETGTSAQIRRGDAPKAVSFSQIASTDFQAVFPNRNFASSPFFAPVAANSPLAGLIGQQIQPISTPLTFGGFSPETIKHFSPMLTAAGFLPVAATGASSEISPMQKFDETTLQGGDSVAMQLTRGDFSLAATGTVTMRDGDKVYAFGHPFLSLGVADLPMSDAPVVTVVPNANNSFKLAMPNKMYGAMTQDRNTAVLGKLGQQARMIPVKMTVRTSRNLSEDYSFEVASDSFLTPLLLNITAFNAITATERGLGESTIAVKGKIKVKGEAETINIDRRFSMMNAPVQAAGAIAVPASFLLNGGFENVQIEDVKIEAVSSDVSKTGVIERLSIGRTQLKAGETLEINAFIRTDRGTILTEKIPVQIPKDTPEGNLLVYVGDGNSLNQVSPARAFVPKTVGELIRTINSVKKADRLYVQLVRVTNGAVVGAKEMPNLPPSVLATLNSDRTVGGVTPTLLSPIFERELPASEYVISGQQVLVVEVVR